MSYKLEKDVAWESSVCGTLYKQLFVHPPSLSTTVRLEGKTAIVTGANSGLGFEASRQLLQRGLSRLVVAVRSQEKGDVAAKKLMEEFPGAEIDLSLLDLWDYDSIKAFVKRCRGLERIDYAILNAGLQRRQFEWNDKTAHEVVLQTNFLSTALLATMLASVMKEKKIRRGMATPPVLTVVGSDTMYFSKLKAMGPVFPLMDDQAQFQGFQQYMDAKLLLMMFTVRLADQYDPNDITLNVCSPGLTYGTNLGQDARRSSPGAALIVRPFVRALGRPLDRGASVYIHALMHGQESHGCFISEWTVKPYAAVMYTEDGCGMMDRLWHEAMEEFKKIPELADEYIDEER
ncbi:hypothetical protein ASPWEDRAFT_29702 [Aspergillus wentii DTO 134E9]|uniref:Ketoreductase (KR) domain-containing protein n=1 Tax=Aspergillus wentii DTO 134E9 TaxID=1073089 RepID=A0A1L9RI77_ASPWE|nr:uncharacterized protein ASPWEDRAFT_29702 [Aspergillus wentii DTO 134E9]OJJ34573.1 hypothetical protein ASPWEDRAFT_29702 [Aspergillus wentii DTO 134E9]